MKDKLYRARVEILEWQYLNCKTNSDYYRRELLRFVAVNAINRVFAKHGINQLQKPLIYNHGKTTPHKAF